MTAGRTRVDAKRLTDFATKALQKVGVPEEDAQITARILVVPGLRGADTHGVANLSGYIRGGICLGNINVTPKPKIFSQAPSIATMDGDRGLGFVIGHRAMMEAIKRAEKTGAGFIAVRNSTHFGAAACYAMMALERDMVGIALSNTPAGVAPPGSAKPAVGTNPIAVAVPSGKKTPFVLDMATSVVAGGKLEVARREGTSIPEGWAIDEEGKPATDPTRVLHRGGEGSLLPLGGTPKLGGYKGFGLGVLVDILCGVLSGSSAGIIWANTPGIRDNMYCHFFGALRIDSFLPVENFKKSMDEMIEAFEALPTLPGVKKIYAAGGYEAEIMKEREANGIPLRSYVVHDLQELAKELGIKYDL